MITIKKLKRLLSLMNKDPEALNVLESLTDEQLKAVPDVSDGDGKAVFFSQGTEEEYQDFLKDEQGLKAWYKRIKEL